MSEPARTRVSPEEALALVLDGARPLGSERVPLHEAIGRILASSATSPVDLPPWDNASMDGYAVRRVDVLGASAVSPVRLRVTGAVAAGARADVALGAGETIRIATGAPVPPGTDAVVRIEDTDRGRDGVTITDDRDARDESALRRNVRPRGEDVRAGAVVLEPGRTIGPAQLGVLASIGAVEMDVVRRPRVAFVSSGDELVDVDRFDEVIGGRAIVSSNSYTIPAMARAAGAVVTDHGVAADALDAVRARIAAALASDCDLLVTSGGISVGEHDHTRAALESFSLEQRFWRARIRPGGPVGFGYVTAPDGRRIAWLGLPGNPVSAMVTFALFGVPLLRTLGGHAHVVPNAVPVRLAHDVHANAALTHYLRCTLAVDQEGGFVASLTGAQGSNLLTSMAIADALLVVPEDVDHAPAGTTLRAIPLGDTMFLPRAGA